MAAEPSKVITKACLEALGYTVEEIAPSETQDQFRADLSAALGPDDRLLVEAKEKGPHQAFLELVSNARAKTSAQTSREVKPWSAIASVIEKAVRQLTSTPGHNDVPRVLSICAMHDDWKFVFSAFRQRLYGEREVAVWKHADNDFPQLLGTRHCLYYDTADFLRFPDLDAVLFTGRGGQQLLLNEFGKRVARVRSSRLHEAAAAAKIVFDPEHARTHGDALAIIADKPLDHKSRWQYLVDKYGFMTNPFRESQFNALLVMRIENPEGAA